VSQGAGLACKWTINVRMLLDSTMIRSRSVSFMWSLCKFSVHVAIAARLLVSQSRPANYAGSNCAGSTAGPLLAPRIGAKARNDRIGPTSSTDTCTKNVSEPWLHSEVS